MLFACFCYHHSGSFPTVGVANPLVFVGVFVGLLPLLCFLLLCLVCFLLDETQIWPGDLRVVCGCVGWLCCFGELDLLLST